MSQFLLRRASRSIFSPRPLPSPVRAHKPFFSRRSESTSSSTSNTSSDPVSNALRDGAGAASLLQAPVHVPHDPRGVLHDNHPSCTILRNPSVVVHRQLEMMNVMLGFEEANKYIILDPQGSHIGYMAEREFGMGNAIGRQLFRTHRKFTTYIFDRSGSEVLRFYRPFSYINSHIRVLDPVDRKTPRTEQQSGPETAIATQSANLRPSLMAPEDMPLVGQASQQWAPLRRKYNLFLARSDLGGDDRRPDLEGFAYIDSPFLSWDFTLRSTTTPITIGSVDRNFSGFGRELFTDTGVYALRMDSAAVQSEYHARERDTKRESREVELLPKGETAMTLDQRAVMLAMAVSIDYDYFSRDRGGLGFMFMPFPLGGPVGGAAGAGEVAGAGVGAAAGGVAEAGAIEGAGAAAAGGLARGVGGAAAAETATGAAAGAGAMAGYEAMQNRRGGYSPAEGPDPRDMPQGQSRQTPEQSGSAEQGGEEVWGADQDPYQQPDQQPPRQSNQSNAKDDNDDFWGDDGGDGDGDGGDGGGILDSLSDFFPD